MTVNRDLNVAYHQQDTSYYCGAACAQMVLDSIGAGLLDQDDLYHDNHSHSVAEPGWATGPDGLEWTMNDRRPAGHNSFVNFALSSEDYISRKICWTIHHYQVAPIALVFGWAHWIVVRGYRASADPSSSGDTSYTINDFDVNNPWPPVPSLYDPSLAPPPPHNNNTDGCGTGGNRGIANENIPYSEWQNTYMTGVPSGYWSGKFIAVCDPEPPPTTRGQLRLHLRRFPGLELITSEAAAELAITSLQEAGLYSRGGSWESGFSNTQPDKPLLVQRLDRPDSYYYIVPMKRGNEDAASAVRLDARFGDYLGAVVPSESRGGGLSAARLSLTLSQEAAFEILASQRIELGPEFGRLRIRRNFVVPYSTLVWKPCLESLSPYYPFYMYIVGSKRLYVRVDGQTFTELHDDVRGI